MQSTATESTSTPTFSTFSIKMIDQEKKVKSAWVQTCKP